MEAWTRIQPPASQGGLGNGSVSTKVLIHSFVHSSIIQQTLLEDLLCSRPILDHQRGQG